MAKEATPFDAFANILTPQLLNAMRTQKEGQLAALDAQLSGRARGDRSGGRLVGGLINQFIGPGRKKNKEARQNQSTLEAAQEAVADQEAQGVKFDTTLDQQEAVINEAIKIARDSGNFDLANDLLVSAGAVDERRANLNLLKSETTLNIARSRDLLTPDAATTLADQKFTNTLVTAAAKGEEELRTALDTQTSDIQKSLSSVGTVNSILESAAGSDYLNKEGSGPGNSFAVNDAAMIRAFMLMLEPNSVVRESEFQTMSDAREAIAEGSITTETAQRIEQFTKGEFLRPGQRRQMVGLVRAEQGRLEDRVSQIVADTDVIIKQRNERISEQFNPQQAAARSLNRDSVLGGFLTNIVREVAPPESKVEEEEAPTLPGVTTSGGATRIRVKVQ